MPAGQQGPYTAMPGSQGSYPQNFAGQGQAVAGGLGNMHQKQQGVQFIQQPQSTAGGMYSATAGSQSTWQPSSNPYRPEFSNANSYPQMVGASQYPAQSAMQSSGAYSSFQQPTNPNEQLPTAVNHQQPYASVNVYSQPGSVNFTQPCFGTTTSQPAVNSGSSYQQFGPSSAYLPTGNASVPSNYISSGSYTVPTGAGWQKSMTGANQQSANSAPTLSTAANNAQNAPLQMRQQNGSVQTIPSTTISNEPYIVKPPVLTRNTSG
jgi:hypothetical protein